MKKLFAMCLITAGAAALTAAPAAENAKAAPEKKAPAKTQQALQQPAQQKNAVPQKPEVPEKKQPYELWMTAQTKAHECIRLKQYDEALKYFDEAAKEANKGSWKNYTLYDKVQLLVQLNRPNEALALLNEKFSRDQDTAYHRARVALMKGEILANAQRYSEAIPEFTAALSSGLNNWISADAAVALGGICEVNQDFAGAEKYYKGLLHDPARLPGIRAKALIAQVKMLEKRKLLAEALAFLDANCNIEQLPADRSADLHFLRSDLQLAQNDLKGARATLNAALKLPSLPGPWFADALTRLARIAVRQKSYNEAQSLMIRSKSVRGHEWGYDASLHKEVNQRVTEQNRARALRERKARLEREKQLREQQRKKLEAQRKAKLEQQKKAKLEAQRKAKLEQQKKAEKGAK